MKPSFDTWTSAFLIAVAMGLFLFFILIATRNRKNLPIAFVLLAFSLILFQYVLYWTGYQQLFPYLSYFPAVCYYCIGPLLYLYFKGLFRVESTIPAYVHFLPALIALTPNIWLWLAYAGIRETVTPVLFMLNGWVIAVHLVLYFFIIFQITRKKRVASSQYSALRRRWANTLLFLFGVFILAYISYYTLVNFAFFNPQWDYMISISMSVSIYAIGYFVIKQPSIFDGELYAELFLPSPNQGDTLESELLNEFYDHVVHYMESEKPYTDNELRLVNLADQVGFSTHLLSKVINNKSGVNFNTFVNEYRLRASEELLLTQPTMSVKMIYFDVGFNNKATFYKAFKEKHNCTPSEYRHRLLKA
ncbi:MAG: helix-turn-helix domain-containing protein [Flavobacteriales bacterium]|jgi:AraC-like DNA-binding protein|uniref:AraC family transcriptional regulator n=1 Tax=Candidatus Ulvibacter alkanivorans TaxID=2267620 RepID=UPI000DF266FC|nr:helix-turn-helix domain-containing protein [Candidatus Ulvibacter alkanivorans]MCH2489470.1 helix-turn-helix domain-containing protein [Flavobacteriales bacterium]